MNGKGEKISLKTWGLGIGWQKWNDTLSAAFDIFFSIWKVIKSQIVTIVTTLIIS